MTLSADVLTDSFAMDFPSSLGLSEGGSYLTDPLHLKNLVVEVRLKIGNAAASFKC